jgi:hypothetical protein
MHKRNMKICNIFLGVLVFILPQTCMSQWPWRLSSTMHSFLFCNTNADSIGASCMVDFINMSRELKSISAALGIDLIENNFVGNNFTVKQFEKVLTDYPFPLPRDIVVIYISAHGSRQPNDTSIYPNIIVEGLTKISTSDFVKQVRSKLTPKLLITIVDACNDTSILSPSYVTHFEKQYVHPFPTVFSATQQANYKALFFDVQGEILVTSSLPGQISWGTTSGGNFTNSFLHAIEANANNTGAVWTKVLTDAKMYTMAHSDFQQRSRKALQVPIWHLSLRYFQDPLTSTGKNGLYEYYQLRLIHQLLDSNSTNEAVHRFSIQCRADDRLDAIDTVRYTLLENHSSIKTVPVTERSKVPMGRYPGGAEAFAMEYKGAMDVKVMAHVVFKDGSKKEITIFHH